MSPADLVPSITQMRWWDLDDVLAVEVPSFGPDAWSRETFLSELAERGSRRYRLLRDPGSSALRGYVGVAAAGADADVQTLAVAPGQRGRGLGRTLVELAKEQARDAGARRVRLEVREDNDAALALYTATGFRPRGRRPGYYAGAAGGPRTAAILMQADLDRPGT